MWGSFRFFATNMASGGSRLLHLPKRNSFFCLQHLQNHPLHLRPALNITSSVRAKPGNILPTFLANNRLHRGAVQGLAAPAAPETSDVSRRTSGLSAPSSASALCLAQRGRTNQEDRHAGLSHALHVVSHTIPKDVTAWRVRELHAK